MLADNGKIAGLSHRHRERLAKFNVILFLLVIISGGGKAAKLIWADDVSLSSNERLLDSDIHSVFREVDRNEGNITKPSLDTVLTVGSLAGTEIDGSLKYDTNGHLQVDKDVKQVFEYFLSTRGEVSLEEIVSGFEQFSFGALPDTAAAEVVELFHSYLIMKADLARLMEEESFSERSTQGYEALDKLDHFFDQRNQTRLMHLGQAVVSEFYGDEIAYDNYQIEKAKISLDATLTKSEKMERLALIEHEVLSPTLAMSVKKERDYNELISTVSHLRAEGASASDIFSVRQKALGLDYATRMQAIDGKRQEWRTRVGVYLSRREDVLGSSMSSVDKENAINELKGYMFSDRERLRLKAYSNLE